MYVVLLCYSDKVRLFIIKVLPISKIVEKAEYTSLLPQKDGLKMEVDSNDDDDIFETGDVGSNHSQSQKDKDMSPIGKNKLKIE